MIMEQKRCPICGKEYTDPPALSRGDNESPICPECGTRQALDAVGITKSVQDEIIKRIYHQTEL